MRPDIVVPQGFFEPEQVEVFGPGAEALACRKVPFPIPIDRDGDVRTDGPPDDLEPLEIVAGLECPTFSLTARKPSTSTVWHTPSRSWSVGMESQPTSVL
jgi:hypothetical protein